MPVAPSMSNLPSPRVVPPLMREISIKASRWAWIAAEHLASSAPRSANDSARRLRPPTSRPKATTLAWSMPALEACATSSSVAGFSRVCVEACSTQLPVMRPASASFMKRAISSVAIR